MSCSLDRRRTVVALRCLRPPTRSLTRLPQSRLTPLLLPKDPDLVAEAFGLLLAAAEDAEPAEDHTDAAGVEQEQVARLVLRLAHNHVAADGAGDDHEALEDGDHVEGLELGEREAEEEEGDRCEGERDQDEEVGVDSVEGIGLAARGLSGGGQALNHLYHRLGGEHVSGERATVGTDDEAHYDGRATVVVVDADGRPYAEETIVHARRRPCKELKVLINGTIDLLVVAKEPDTDRAEADENC
eukprot:CAMPEP_0183380778 /NCGR_PEP_ID=MMETSP0164_2-20130417/126106_1 /TAXON_ID=221442 /ORGANISM="Coccolithus pelagicus ssp braarudi, Strain PLY182g" /LENGTH=242 /DNA_ID=CAMNT_0025558379 /DNA_START=523 /DNA_END=1249 /DNA_ORIENTATION=-